VKFLRWLSCAPRILKVCERNFSWVLRRQPPASIDIWFSWSLHVLDGIRDQWKWCAHPRAEWKRRLVSWSVTGHGKTWYALAPHFFTNSCGDATRMQRVSCIRKSLYQTFSERIPCDLRLSFRRSSVRRTFRAWSSSKSEVQNFVLEKIRSSKLETSNVRTRMLVNFSQTLT